METCRHLEVRRRKPHEWWNNQTFETAKITNFDETKRDHVPRKKHGNRHIQPEATFKQNRSIMWWKLLWLSDVVIYSVPAVGFLGCATVILNQLNQCIYDIWIQITNLLVSQHFQRGWIRRSGFAQRDQSNYRRCFSPLGLPPNFLLNCCCIYKYNGGKSTISLSIGWISNHNDLSEGAMWNWLYKWTIISGQFGAPELSHRQLTKSHTPRHPKYIQKECQRFIL